MLKLNDLATANRSNLESAFTGLLAALGNPESDRVGEFLDWAEAICRITVNVKLFVVADLLSGRKYLNIYERSALDASIFGVPEDAILRNTLGTFYDRRMAFDSAFERGREFLYGALTAGNGGLRAYDPYCIQLREALPATAQVISYVLGDSLVVCFTDSGEFDERKARQSLGPHSHRHIMAAIKYSAQVPSTPKSDWPAMLANKANYIEAIFVADVTLSTIEKIQVLRAEYDRLFSLVLASVGRKLDAAELNLVYFFRSIMVARRDNVVNVEIVS